MADLFSHFFLIFLAAFILLLESLGLANLSNVNRNKNTLGFTILVIGCCCHRQLRKKVASTVIQIYLSIIMQQSN
ncbi:MAG: hypothetical protein ACI9UD_002607 [Glaciecola sp.]|jgi:hypothetical protein